MNGRLRNFTVGLLVSGCVAGVVPGARFTDAIQAATVSGGMSAPLPSPAMGMAFERNTGWSDPSVRYVLRGPQSTVFLTDTGIVLTANPVVPQGDVGRRLAAEGRASSFSTVARPAMSSPVVRVRWAGGNLHPVIHGVQRLPGVVNYFLGNDRSRWRVNVPRFESVVYQGVYPGVNLRFHLEAGELEYDWLVKPGADASRINVAVAGRSRLRLDVAGNLIIGGPGGVIQRTPVAFQHVGSKKIAVAAKYVIGHSRSVQLRLGGYDHTRPLVIDPAIGYAVSFGGGGYAQGQGIAVNRVGDAYVVGYTEATDFPTAHSLQPSEAGGEDVFLTKLSANGSRVLFSTYLGGHGSDEGLAIALDKSGAIYITGDTSSENFPTVHAYQSDIRSTCSDGINTSYCPTAFVTKLNPSGDSLLYSTYLGGNNGDSGYAIAVDASHHAYVTGQTISDDFPTVHALQPKRASVGCSGDPVLSDPCEDGFVTKLAPSGSSLVFSTYLGGGRDDEGFGIAVDRHANVYLTGYTQSRDFPTVHAIERTPTAQKNAFATEINAAGTAFVYSTFLGHGSETTGINIAVSHGSAYITGTGILVKIRPGGTGLAYSSDLSAHVEGYGIAVDRAGDAYVTGDTGSSQMPVVNPVQASRAGGHDAFLSELDPAGTALIQSTFLGGKGDDYAQGVAIDSAGNAYITGYTYSTDFPHTTSPASAGHNVFVARIGNFPAKGSPVMPTPVVKPLRAATPVAGGPKSPVNCKKGFKLVRGKCTKMAHARKTAKPGRGGLSS